MAAPRSDKPPKDRLMGWSEYYLARGLDRSSPVAMLMCFVMSLYHLIHQAGLEKLDTLCVHWLGGYTDASRANSSVHTNLVHFLYVHHMMAMYPLTAMCAKERRKS